VSLGSLSEMKLSQAEYERFVSHGQLAYLRSCRDLSIPPSRKVLDQLGGPVVNVAHFGLGETGAKALATALASNPPISELNLVDSGLTPNATYVIAESIRQHSRLLQRLDVSRNEVSQAGALAISRILVPDLSVAAGSLVSLTLSSCSLTDSAAEGLATGLANNRSLKYLDLSNNGIGCKGAAALASVLGDDSRIVWLSLRWNRIRDPGANALATAIGQNFRLKYLDLGHNGIGSHGGEWIARALKDNQCLEVLDLSHNNIGTPTPPEVKNGIPVTKPLIKGMKPFIGPWVAFANAYKEGCSLRLLKISGNSLSPEDTELLDNAVTQSPALTSVEFSVRPSASPLPEVKEGSSAGPLALPPPSPAASSSPTSSPRSPSASGTSTPSASPSPSPTPSPRSSPNSTAVLDPLIPSDEDLIGTRLAAEAAQEIEAAGDCGVVSPSGRVLHCQNWLALKSRAESLRMEAEEAKARAVAVAKAAKAAVAAAAAQTTAAAMAQKSGAKKPGMTPRTTAVAGKTPRATTSTATSTGASRTNRSTNSGSSSISPRKAVKPSGR